MKGFKVCLDDNMGIKKGIAANTLEDLKAKIAIKFEIQSNKKKKAKWNCLQVSSNTWNKELKGYHIFLDDGTEVDDEEYFQILSPQCLLIVSEKPNLSIHTKGEESTHFPKGDTTMVNPFEDLLKIIRWQGGAAEAVEKIRSLFVMENSSDLMSSDEKEMLLKRWKSMIDYVQKTNDNKLTILSSREDHPAWFQDISTNAKTKEEYLSKGCQARIRGYLSKARTQLVATKFSDLLADAEKTEKEDPTKALNSSFRSCRKNKRSVIRQMNESEPLNNEEKEENMEIFDEDNWDEIDASFIQSYRESMRQSHDECDASSDASTLASSLIEETIVHFQNKLKENKYHGYLFDRSRARGTNQNSSIAVNETSICDKIGTFKCEGKYDDDNGCAYNRESIDDTKNKDEKFYSLIHSINPYESSESRIMFSTWNLDHVIERSRTIIPSLIKAIVKIASEDIEEDDLIEEQPLRRNRNHKSCVDTLMNVRNDVTKKYNRRLGLKSRTSTKRRKLNKDYFYEMLFTRKNLKLVHIVCHDKQEHLNRKCDETQMFLED